MSVRYVTNLVAGEALIHAVAKAAITGAVMYVDAQAKNEARGGFKSGAFVTRGWQSITWAVSEGRGMVTGFVGSTEKHFMFWEMGHHNAWTRQFEQNRWLTRAFQNKAGIQTAARTAAVQVGATFGLGARAVGRMVKLG